MGDVWMTNFTAEDMEAAEVAVAKPAAKKAATKKSTSKSASKAAAKVLEDSEGSDAPADED